MTPEANITTGMFWNWIHHFEEQKMAGNPLLIVYAAVV